MRPYNVHEVEAKWQRAWDRSRCHQAPRLPQGEKYFVHDAAPFPNGELHLGHVRTYLLGDMTARYQRLLGKSVLYHTGFDAFGLPIELEAIEHDVSPRELVQRSIETMTQQLKQLGISYDWSCIPNTSDPNCYRWTQWLFREMYEAGIVERREAPLNWCPRCETTLARLQVEEGNCWRCGSAIETRRLAQWFILTSRYAGRLLESLDRLDGWSDRSRGMIAGLLHELMVTGKADGSRATDWLVSRQRSWGTPIPIVHCHRCGTVPVPARDLPVVLPDDLDWASGSGALSRKASFVETTCPTCAAPATRETDTLDCFFDDIWCFLQVFVLRAGDAGLTRETLQGWLPVDRCQSGLDTFYYFHLYRFLGLFLVERGIIDDPELIRSFLGNDLVLREGRKMSKHLGNAVSPAEILEVDGADALRVAMLWAAGPQRAIDWRQENVSKAVAWLDAVYRMFEQASLTLARSAAPSGHDARGASRKALALTHETSRIVTDVARFIEEYRPNAAIEVLVALQRRIDAFASRRIDSSRLNAADGAALEQLLGLYAIAMAPFAPHLAEQVWRMLGQTTLIATARWPEGQPTDGR